MVSSGHCLFFDKNVKLYEDHDDPKLSDVAQQPQLHDHVLERSEKGVLQTLLQETSNLTHYI